MTSRIRPARPDDCESMHALIVQLADYEEAADRVRGDAEALRAQLFGESPAVFAHVAVETDADADADADGVERERERDRVVGIAIWFLTYSTWEARHGIHLEDLFVAPDARGRGHGLALMRALARICVDRGYARFEWQVLDWNTPAIEFYERLGAEPLDGWHSRRLEGEALRALAGDGE